jgi:hypothetical protein
MSKIRFVGRDVHADTIAVAVAEPSGEVRSLGLITNRPESVRKLMHKLSPVEQLLRTDCICATEDFSHVEKTNRRIVTAVGRELLGFGHWRQSRSRTPANRCVGLHHQ